MEEHRFEPFAAAIADMVNFMTQSNAAAPRRNAELPPSRSSLNRFSAVREEPPKLTPKLHQGAF
jgi:hypothetical protein